MIVRVVVVLSAASAGVGCDLGRSDRVSAVGRVVSGRELAEAFSPTDAEVEWARGRTQDQQHLLALVVWLKSFQRLGYFPKVEDVPLVVIGHVRAALGLGEGAELERAAVRSAKRHRKFVRERMGVTYDAAGVRKIAEDAIRKAVQAKDNPADLINVALDELVRVRSNCPAIPRWMRWRRRSAPR